MAFAEQKSRYRSAFILVLEVLGLLLCILMISTRGHTEEKVDIAVLKNKTEEIDHHLQNTDSSVDLLRQQVNTQNSAISRMEGQEELAWSILGLLSTTGIVIHVSKKNKE